MSGSIPPWFQAKPGGSLTQLVPQLVEPPNRNSFSPENRVKVGTRAGSADVAVARIEQLYPFPVDALSSLLALYPALSEIVWAQEEPQNMGAWRSIRHRLEDVAGAVPVRYVGRPWRASPSEGYPTAHLREQDRIVRVALGSPA